MTTTSSTSAWARLSSAARRHPILGAAVALVALLCLALIVVYASLQTEPGRIWLARTLESALSQPGQREVAVGRISGHLPAEILIDELTVADRNGTWLSARGLAVDWNPLAMLRGRVEITSAEAREVAIARRPETSASAPGDGLPRLPPIAIEASRITIDSLRLEEPLLGTAAALRAAAKVNVSADAVLVRLDVSRTDSVAGHANAIVAYDPALESLELHAELSEPPGGLVARLLQLPRLPAIELALAGDGPAAEWRGTANLDAEELVAFESRLTVSIRGPEMHVSVEGTARPGDAAGIAERALGPQTEFAMALARPGSGELIVTVHRLESAAITASGSAELGLPDGTIAGLFQVETRDAKRIAPFVAPATLAAGRVEGRLRGPLTHPAIELDAELDSPEVAGWSARKIEVHAGLRPDGPIGGPGPLRIEARATLAAFRGPMRELNTMFGDSVQITIAQTALEGRSRLIMGEATVVGVGARGTVAADLALETGRMTAHGQLEIDDLSPLSERAGRPLGGRLRSRYQVSLQPDAALSVEVDGTLHDGRLGVAVADALLGPQAAFAGRIVKTADGQWIVSDASVKGAGATARGRLSVPPGGDRIAAEYGMMITDLVALGLADPAALGGNLEISGTASGPAESPAIAGTAVLTAAAPAGFAVDRLTAHYSLPGLADPVKGHIELDGATPLLPDVSGKLDFALKDRVIELAPLQVSARGTVVRGTLAIPLAGPPVTGKLSVSAADLGKWSPVARRNLAGRLTATATLSADKGRQQFLLKSSANAFALDDAVASENLSAEAKVSDAFGERVLAMSLTSGAGRIGALKVEALEAEFSGTETDARLSLRGSGEFNGPLRLEADGTMHREAQRTILTVARLTGEVMGTPIALRNPAAAEFGVGLQSARVEVNVGEGSASASFHQTPAGMSLDAAARALPLALFWADAPPQAKMARIDANAALSGPASRPDGYFDISLSGLAPGEMDSAPEGLALNMEARMQNGTLAANGRFKGLGAASAEIEAKLPVRFSLSPFTVGFDEAAPASGRIHYTGPIEPLAAVAELDRHRLEGTADVRLELAGSLGAPRIQGSARLAEGRYENLDTGTILNNITVRARPAGDSIIIDEATAGDGDGGRIAMTGNIGLGGPTGMTMTLDANFDSARLVRRDEVTALSSGTVSLRGDGAARTIAGRLDIEEAEIRLIASARPEIVQIEVEETGTAPAGLPPPPPAPRASNTHLDLALAMPKRMFVRGRGLESEWGGELLLTGTTASPRLQGTLRPLRGRYDFLGKIFELRDGNIDFTGAERIDPALNLSAERAVDSMTAIIRITGTARRPVVQMTSIPEFPPDEVLSRVLFNKSTGRLTAMEAVQLGQAAAAMTGATEGGGIVDFGRRTLTLDVLEFKSPETSADDPQAGQTSVEAGKYVTDDVYIGVEGGAAGATGATVEIEVTPRLRIEGDVGQKEKESIGLKWKWDY